VTVPSAAAPGDAATGLVRRTVSVAPGAWFAGIASAGGELWFTIAGSGWLRTFGAGGPDAWHAPGTPAGCTPGTPVGSDTGVWLPPGCGYRLDAGTAVRLDAVALPAVQPDAAGTAQPPRIAAVGDCPVERTGDRRFRVLLGPGRGCEAATQFVGEIPPGRAPQHSHPYDEVVYVLEGTGVAHAGSSSRPLTPGTRVHLPRGLPHCLENTGPAALVVLGVFHPGGSPAAKCAPPAPGELP
jgi:quercetin dioxygenase-like cupin family protein